MSERFLQDSRLGPCLVGRRLGSGASGDVYSAELVEDRPYAPLGARVVAKVIRAPADSAHVDIVQRFLRESEIGIALDHPRVVRTYEANTLRTNGVHLLYLIQEYVAGRALTDLMRALGCVPEPLMRLIGSQIAAALDAIHTVGVVHRDVKPANILVTPSHEVKLIDIGIARYTSLGATLTAPGEFVGSPLYAAPEQFGDGHVTAQADLYSLGVVLFEALAGERPFAGDDFPSVMHSHLSEPPRPLRTLVPTVSPFLEQVCSVLLDKNPQRRFQTAAAVAELLLEGEEGRWWTQRRQRRLRGVGVEVRGDRSATFRGRGEELSQLEKGFERALDGHGSLVLVRGEPGIGKTRLLLEFSARLESRHDEFIVLYGTHSPGDLRTAHGALARALRAHFGRADLASHLATHMKQTPTMVAPFAARLGAELPTADANAETLPELSPQAVPALFCQVMRSLAAEAAVVLLIEDLHTASSEAVDLLLDVARATRDRPALIVVTTRPTTAELDARLARHDGLETIESGRLPKAAMSALVQEALAQRGLTAGLETTIANRAAGNPFFALELVGAHRRAHDTSAALGSAESKAMPDSVRGLLLERLRTLDDRQRSYLELAAVCGVAFDAGLVGQALGHRRMAAVEAFATIERATGIVKGAGLGFRFDHHLLHEVVLDTLSTTDLEACHDRLADACEATLAGAPAGEESVDFATHRLLGSQPLRGLSWIRQALSHLASLGHNEAGIELAELALAHVPEQDAEARIDLLLRQAEFLDAIGQREQQTSVLEEALASARLSNDRPRLARVLCGLGKMRVHTASYATAESLLQEAQAIAAEVGDALEEVQALTALGTLRTRTARIPEAFALLRRALELARQADDANAERACHGELAHASSMVSDWPQVETHLKRAVELSRVSLDIGNEAINLVNLGLVHHARGDVQRALEQFQRGAEASRAAGVRRGEAAALANLGAANRDLGQYGAARRFLEQSVELSRQIDYRDMEVLAHHDLCDLALVEGALARAEGHNAIALEMARAIGAKRELVIATCQSGVLAHARHDDTEGRRRFEQSLKTAREVEMVEVLGGVLRHYGRLLTLAGDHDRAKQILREAVEILPYEGERSVVTAYLALADPSVEASAPPPTLSVPEAAELHAVLYLRDRQPQQLETAWLLLEQISAHLSADERDTFWEHGLICQLLPGTRET